MIRDDPLNLGYQVSASNLLKDFRFNFQQIRNLFKKMKLDAIFNQYLQFVTKWRKPWLTKFPLLVVKICEFPQNRRDH
jgi:hypothetical protein